MCDEAFCQNSLTTCNLLKSCYYSSYHCHHLSVFLYVPDCLLLFNACEFGQCHASTLCTLLI